MFHDLKDPRRGSVVTKNFVEFKKDSTNNAVGVHKRAAVSGYS